MARTVRDTNLETRTARLRLAPRGKPYYRLIDQGCHLGYRRNKRGAGVWVARRFVGHQSYKVQKLGQADDVRDADGIEVMSFTQAQAKLRLWLAHEARNAAGIHEEKPQQPYTVADAMHDYLAWYARHRKALRNTRYAVEAHILPALGEIELAKLTRERIERWRDHLAEKAPRRRTRMGDRQRFGDSPSDDEGQRARRATANRVLTTLKAALTRAFEHGKIGSDEAWQRVKPFREADAARIDYRAEAECTRILNACEPDFRRLVRAALVSGCRYGELCRLEVCDFNPDAATLRVRKSKPGKPRHIPLDSQAVDFFRAITAGRTPNERIFLRADGKAWGKSNQARPLLYACEIARVPRTSFNILRHTWASQRIMKGAPIIAVAQVLGHRDTRMVERHYGHLAPSFVRNAIEESALDFGPHGEDQVVPLRISEE